jgi:predicted nucleotidyltransferase
VDKDAAVEAIRKFKKALERKNIKVDKIVLFGSYAKGTQKDGSDIDVAVISKDFQGKDYWTRIEILTDAIYEVFEPIEAVPFTPEEWERSDRCIIDYAREGEVV